MCVGIITQQDGLSLLYWHLCSDHRVFPPARKQRNIVQICTSCVHARVWCVIVNDHDVDEEDDDDDDEDDDEEDEDDDEDECVIVDDT